MRSQLGLTLVELMVAFMVSALTMLAIISSSHFLDSQKRLTMGANNTLEAVTVETIGLATDVRMAGLGMVFGGYFFCNTIVGQSGFIPPIEVKSDGNSDSLTIAYADTPFGIASTTFKQKVTGSTAFNPNQLNYNPGGLIKILTRDQTNKCVVVSSGEPPAIPIIKGATAIPIREYHNITYKILNNTLIIIDNLTGIQNEVAANIVYMKIYGLVGGVWQSAIGKSFVNNSALSSQAGVTAPSALKIFLIAREQRFATKRGACNATTQTSLNQSLPWTPGTDGPTVSLNNNADWQCYNYQALELGIPLINLTLGAQIL